MIQHDRFGKLSVDYPLFVQPGSVLEHRSVHLTRTATCWWPPPTVVRRCSRGFALIHTLWRLSERRCRKDLNANLNAATAVLMPFYLCYFNSRHINVNLATNVSNFLRNLSLSTLNFFLFFEILFAYRLERERGSYQFFKN